MSLMHIASILEKCNDASWTLMPRVMLAHAHMLLVVQVLVNTSSNCFGMLTNRVDTSMLDTASDADVNVSVG